jgi:hypothetical protein
MTDDRGPLFDEDFWQQGAGLTEHPLDLTPTLKFADPEQVASLMGTVRQYVTGAQTQPALLGWLGSPITVAANEQMREFFAAVKYHPPIVTVTATFPVRVIEAADYGTATEDARVEVRRDARLAGLNAGQVLVLVLVWLFTFGLPAAQLVLPPKAQSVLTNDYATFAIALAITWRILDKRER